MKVVAALPVLLALRVLGDGCGSSVSELVVGKSYRMQLRDGSSVGRVRYLGRFGEDTLEFGHGLGGSLRIAADGIADVEPVSGRASRLIFPPLLF